MNFCAAPPGGIFRSHLPPEVPMKALLLVSMFVSANAFAWPGSRSVSCHSLPGAKQKVSLVVAITGTPTPDMPAEVDLIVDAMSVKLDDPERTAIALVDHPEDKVITAAYEERDTKHETTIEVWAHAATIKGGLDKGTCRGHYTFRAGFSGGISTTSENPDDYKSAYVDNGTLDCEYNSSAGSAGC
jgi:hypothetical protein